MDKKRTMMLIILASIILFHLINNYIWLKMDNTYLLHDAHWHFLFSLRVFDEIRNSVIPILSNIFNDFVYYRWHGIFVAYITAPFYFIFGTSQNAGVMINAAIFLTILVFSTYGIGKKLFNEKAGLLATFIVTMYPLIFNHLRIYMLDLPLTSMITLSIYLLLLTENFTNKNYSLLFAISAGLGMLTKFSFVGFIIGPLSLVLYRACINKKIQLIQKKNILTVFLIIIIIPFAFYRLKFWEVFNRIYECSWLYTSSNFSVHSLFLYIYSVISLAKDFLLWCLKNMINNSISFLFFCAFVIGLPIFFIKKIGYKKILYLWILLPILFLTLIFRSPEISRYTMPLMPAIAIISGIGIAGIKYLKLQKTIIFLVVILGYFQYFTISYNIPFLPAGIEVSLPYLKKIYILNRNIEIPYRNNLGMVSYPSRVDWKEEEILREILKLSDDFKQRKSVFFVDDVTQVYEPLAYRLFVEKQPVDIHVNSLATEERYEDSGGALDLIIMADYVVIKKVEKNSLGSPSQIRERIKETRRLFEENITKFKLIREFKLQDGSILLLFKNKLAYIKIVKGQLELYFRGGLTKLYYNGTQISKYLGLKTSFKPQARNFSSAQAIWDVIKLGDSKIVAIATWKESPFSQKWELEILNSHIISWKVRMKITEKAEIKYRIFALILSERYREWLNFEDKGEFTNENILADKEIIFPEMKQKYLGVCSFKNAGLPEIIFYPNSGLYEIAPVIVWNKSHRVIKFYEAIKKDIYFLPPGEYNFFSGAIIIGEDEKNHFKENF